MRDWDYFQDGARLGGVTVLELLNATQSKGSTTYRVVCHSCNTESVMKHQQLFDRSRKDRSHCMTCRYRGPVKYPEPEGVRDLRGQLWPRLKGPMGPRWGLGIGSNSWIGRGASEAPIR